MNIFKLKKKKIGSAGDNLEDLVFNLKSMILQIIG